MESVSQPKASLKERLKRLLSEYGPIAFVVYLVLFGVVLLGFFVAISAGFATERTAGGVGTLAAAWLATKLTQPLRIAATLLLTPFIGLALRRFRRRSLDDAPRDGQPPSEHR